MRVIGYARALRRGTDEQERLVVITCRQVGLPLGWEARSQQTGAAARHKHRQQWSGDIALVAEAQLSSLVTGGCRMCSSKRRWGLSRS